MHKTLIPPLARKDPLRSPIAAGLTPSPLKSNGCLRELWVGLGSYLQSCCPVSQPQQPPVQSGLSLTDPTCLVEFPCLVPQLPYTSAKVARLDC